MPLIFASLIILIGISAIITHYTTSHDKNQDFIILQDSIAFLNDNMSNIKHQYDSLHSIVNIKESQETHRQNLKDSLRNNISSQLLKISIDAKNELKKVPFVEFSYSCIQEHVQKAVKMGEEINNLPIDNEMKSIIHNHYQRTWVYYYNELSSLIHKKPVIKQDSMSIDEYNHYLKLLNDNQPYKAYK